MANIFPRIRVWPATAALSIMLACGKSSPPLDEPSTPPGPPPNGQHSQRPTLTAAQCETRGGVVVGDIGDGAVLDPSYLCTQTGEPPIGDIASDPDGPIGVEGSVCCATEG